MRLHELKPKHKNKDKKRVGRGGSRGSFCGRGVKGQKARTGSNFQPIIRPLIKKYPKLRGYQFKSQDNVEVINLGVIDQKFELGDTINPQILVDKNLVDRVKGKLPEVKILGEGEINKELIIENCNLSKSAGEKIREAGGEIKREE